MAKKPVKKVKKMRGGGMMGFRPVGYADGDLVEQPESGFLTPSEREQLADFT